MNTVDDRLQLARAVLQAADSLSARNTSSEVEISSWLSQAEPKELPSWIQDHLNRYLATNGEDGYLWDASLGGGKGLVPTLLLTTIGRKSGRDLSCR